MSLYDFVNNRKVEDKWKHVESAFACPECDTPSDECYYSSEEGIVKVFCENGHQEEIFIGRGL